MSINSFKKTKDYLICVDSDGCAMDTMDIKHFRCFGPCMVREWALEAWQEPILQRWNEINLYTMTRGVNRFKGLVMALGEIDAQYTPIEGLDALQQWVQTSAALSNKALEDALQQAPNAVCLQKALRWSQAVNTSIQELPQSETKPFEGVLQGLAAAHEVANVAIVSSANPDAVHEEWQRHGLLAHVDCVMAQDAGTKAHCIELLLTEGYAPQHVLMVGDAPGDADAAAQNGVHYYPILVRKEAQSWQEFVSDALPCLLADDYTAYGAQKHAEFLQNLGG